MEGGVSDRHKPRGRSRGRRFLRRSHRRLKLQQVDFRQHGRAPRCALTVSGRGELSVHLPPLPYALALAPTAESFPATENFFKNVLRQKGYPLLGQKPFLDRFLGEVA